MLRLSPKDIANTLLVHRERKTRAYEGLARKQYVEHSLRDQFNLPREVIPYINPRCLLQGLSELQIFGFNILERDELARMVFALSERALEEEKLNIFENIGSYSHERVSDVYSRKNLLSFMGRDFHVFIDGDDFTDDTHLTQMEYMVHQGLVAKIEGTYLNNPDFSDRPDPIPLRRFTTWEMALILTQDPRRPTKDDAQRAYDEAPTIHQNWNGYVNIKQEDHPENGSLAQAIRELTCSGYTSTEINVLLDSITQAIPAALNEFTNDLFEQNTGTFVSRQSTIYNFIGHTFQHQGNGNGSSRMNTDENLHTGALLPILQKHIHEELGLRQEQDHQLFAKQKPHEGPSGYDFDSLNPSNPFD